MKHLNTLIVAFVLCLVFSEIVHAQNVAVTDDEYYVADPSAMLDVKSIDKGILIPRLTKTQREAISSPANGLMVYDTNYKSFFYYDGKSWLSFPQLSTSVTEGEALFAVLNSLGDTVFAVYNDGVKVSVPTGTKGKIGGFAVSGRTSTKSSEVDYLRVTPDSTRVYVSDNPVKGRIGGFAVSGRTSTKVGYNEYFNVSGAAASSVSVINPGEARMLWYPKSEALLVGRVLVEHPDSVGLNSLATGYESKAIGDWSQALGFKSIARSNYSTAIGKNAVANGLNSFAFGNEAVAYSDDAFAIGSGALAIGKKSFAFGSVGVDTLGDKTDNPKAIGDYSFAIGLGTKSTGFGATSLGANTTADGDFSISLGYYSYTSGSRAIALGPYSQATGTGSTAFGYNSKATNTSAVAGGGENFASGIGSVALGTFCEASGDRSVAMGDGCISTSYGSLAMGKNSEATANGAIAIGFQSIASGVNSVALGARASTNGMEGAFVFNGASEKTEVNATLPGQVVFLGTGGLNFYANSNLDQLNSFVIKASTGNIGVGTSSPKEKMEIKGGNLLMEGGDINLNGGSVIEGAGKIKLADYVFENDYQLETIEKHAEFMWANKHLPALKSAKDLEAEGKINISERREQIVEELEKAHIYIEQLNNEIKTLKNKNEVLEEKYKELHYNVQKFMETMD